MGDVETLKDLVRDHVNRADDPVVAAIGLIGLLTANIAARKGARHAAELLWSLGDKTVELSPPGDRLVG